ncbi:MAG: plasmid pRiA4b ORF-3 family protein [Deltaproteobacteria bacterium]|nr:plasmid pRiA4b ORF-3 family protein [Deltaproteobacteria bacterium]
MPVTLGACGKASLAPAGFRLRIELKEVLPPVWRRFLVPGSITLPGLHRVIQAVMGWENCHLHLFRFGNKEYGIPDPEFPSEMRNERGRRLHEFLRNEGETFGYEYDFGDSWEHDLVVERIVTGAEAGDTRCMEGERACPAEDVGGPPGYMDYLEALRDPSHPDHEEMVMWRGTSFDPERFNLERINRRLSQLSRRHRLRQVVGPR